MASLKTAKEEYYIIQRRKDEFSSEDIVESPQFYNTQSRNFFSTTDLNSATPFSDYGKAKKYVDLLKALAEMDDSEALFEYVIYRRTVKIDEMKNETEVVGEEE